MAEVLVFDKIYKYNTLENGITVTAKLFSGTTFIEVRTKIDTGAAHCIFERKHAERLGINVESGELLTFATAVGTFLAFGHEINLSVLDIETTSTVYFAADENFARNVLGQTGWLDRVKLGLIDYEGKLFLSSYNEEI